MSCIMILFCIFKWKINSEQYDRRYRDSGITKYRYNLLAMIHSDSIAKLAAVFNTTTNSYKYYWFLAILHRVKMAGSREMKVDDLLLDMISMVAYPLDFYRLSFGSQDGFKAIIQKINGFFTIDYSTSAADLRNQLDENLTPEQKHDVLASVQALNRWVPYRFLTPFFSGELRGLEDTRKNRMIIDLSQKSVKKDPGYCPYFFRDDAIILDDTWYHFLRENIGLLESFACWHLVRFLQGRNPNVPGIPDKIFRPGKRDLRISTHAWRNFLHTYPQTRCIYTNDILPEAFSIDHFIPWSFVVHDLNWNLTPITREINSSKSCNLPNLRKYLEPFSDQQHSFMIWTIKEDYKKIIEEYCGLFHARASDIVVIPRERFRVKMEETIAPLVQIAENLGFCGGWEYGG